MKIKTIYTNEYLELINYLIKLRKVSLVNQTEMAKHLKLSQSDISKIEKCDKKIDILETFNWIERCNDNPQELIELYNLFKKIKYNNEEL